LANGAILGSSFIQLLEKSTNLNKDIPKFITSILSPLNSSAS
jgi:tryptophan synthase alpha subunit